jgi:N-acetylmuramoyl-L-alanine amidase
MAEDYNVSAGECMHSIAFEHGFFWETLWNHPNNAALKDLREDPSVLMECDVVHIPDLTVREESCAAEQRHRFRLKGVPALVRIRVVVDDEPRANQPYTLYLDDVEAGEGTTDGDGQVEVSASPAAREGRLVVGEGDDEVTVVFQLGTVDPLDTDQGALGRLHNLGYDVSQPEEAIRGFQTREGLKETGTIDDATRQRIGERFGQ